MQDTKLAIVIPCFNEAQMLPVSLQKLWNILHKLIDEKYIGPESFVFLVDDGSLDNTWDIIKKAYENSEFKVKAIRFSRNFGNQSAIIAGLENVYNLGADAAITIDADLQQDENKIVEFVKAYDEGYDIVCGIRKNRTDGLFKKTCANLFYKVINFLGVNIKPNHSEFRLVSRRTLVILLQYKETNLFIRGLFYDLGLKTKDVYFEVKEREFGKSKFSFFSLLALAARGIVSFSVRPLRIVFFLGFGISFVSVLLAIACIVRLIFHLNYLPGLELFETWETFATGMEILCIGIIGEYIGQILMEVKARPRYITDEELK
ncbi:MAG: glycosyltransferase family 2 protein [Candidatus Gastranaerophilales bacterium]|nr:glycosyltransferase family 2 protein [Candidatus Gastranaerophilales bacterium]